MTWHNRVWSGRRGCSCSPEHFQQHDRFTEYQTAPASCATSAMPRGFTTVAVDDAALALGKLSINSAQGVLPDGTAFSIPGNDAAPAAIDIPADARDELRRARPRAAAPRHRRDRCRAGRPVRWRRASACAEVEVGDSNASVRSRRRDPDRPAEPAPRCSSRDAGEGYATIGAASVVERRADNKLGARRQLHAADAACAGPSRSSTATVRELLRPAAPARRGAGGAAVAARTRRRRRDRRLPAAGGGEPLRAAVRAAAAALGAAPGNPLRRRA